MIKPVLFVDIDGVMAESISWWLTIYNTVNGTNYKKEDVTGYDTRLCINVDLSPYFSNYGGVLPVANAFESIYILEERYRIVFATVGYGAQWLRGYLPKTEVAQIQDKSLLRGFALIDDKPSNLDSFMGERFLLSQPWNQGRGLNDTTWPEITRYLMEDKVYLNDNTRRT